MYYLLQLEFSLRYFHNISFYIKMNTGKDEIIISH